MTFYKKYWKYRNYTLLFMLWEKMFYPKEEDDKYCMIKCFFPDIKTNMHYFILITLPVVIINIIFIIPDIVIYMLSYETRFSVPPQFDNLPCRFILIISSISFNVISNITFMFIGLIILSILVILNLIILIITMINALISSIYHFFTCRNNDNKVLPI